VQADAELKTTILRCCGIHVSQALLHRNRALNGIYSARELGQNAITSRVGDSPPMLGNRSVHNLASGS
jgi:hypothetical protein